MAHSSRDPKRPNRAARSDDVSQVDAADPSPELGTVQGVPDALSDSETRDTLAADERTGPAGEINPHEPAAPVAHDEVEGFDAQAERVGENRPLLEADALRYVGSIAITPEGDDLGEVRELVLNANGTVQGVLLTIDGARDWPEEAVAIAWDEIEVSADGRLVITVAPEELQDLPPPD